MNTHHLPPDKPLAEPCQQVRRVLTDRLWSPDDLAEAERAAAHLRGCPACRAAAADYGLLRDLLGHAPEPDPLEEQDRLPPPQLFGGISGGHGPLHIGGWRWRWPQTLAWAALLALAVAGWWHRPAVPSPGPPPLGRASMPAASGAWQPNEAQQQARLFHEVSETFDDRTGWVALAGERSDLGLLPQPATGPQELVLLRLTLWRDGEQVSRTDLAVLAGQTAELAVPILGGQELSYRIGVSTARPRELRLWAELSAPYEPGQVIAALATRVPVQVDRVLPAAEFVSSAGTYELRISFAHQEIPPR